MHLEYKRPLQKYLSRKITEHYCLQKRTIILNFLRVITTQWILSSLQELAIHCSQRKPIKRGQNILINNCPQQTRLPIVSIKHLSGVCSQVCWVYCQAIEFQFGSSLLGATTIKTTDWIAREVVYVAETLLIGTVYK